MTGFLASVKRASVEAVAASKPFGFLLGTVTAVDPLTIQVDQKFILGEAQLMLTNGVRDFVVTLVQDPDTDLEYSRTYRVKLALTVGETVLLLRTDGGQKFIVLDRTSPRSEET